jgi:hypothetical protein
MIFPSATYSPRTVKRKARLFVMGTVRLNSALHVSNESNRIVSQNPGPEFQQEHDIKHREAPDLHAGYSDHCHHNRPRHITTRNASPPYSQQCITSHHLPHQSINLSSLPPFSPTPNLPLPFRFTPKRKKSLTSLSNQQKEPHTPRQIHHQRDQIRWFLPQRHDGPKRFRYPPRHN